MSCDDQGDLKRTVEQWFWDFCADVPRLTMTRFVFEKGMCGWSVQSTMGERSFEMWNDRGEVWVRNVVCGRTWDYPARNLAEYVITPESKKVHYLLGLVQSDEFVAENTMPSVQSYEKNQENGPVI